MKTLATFIQKFRGSHYTGDSVQDFFMKENNANKKTLYEQALRGAQADQLKVLERARVR